VDLTIGVDVGGTKIAAGVVDTEGRILQQLRVSTPAATAASVEQGIVEAVLRLKAEHEVGAVGVAVPGFVDQRRSVLRFTPNLPMRNRPLREILTPQLGVETVIENDANAAAWGEFQFGGGKDVEDMVLITVGTGLGGGIVENGVLRRGAFGSAAELGHMRMVPGGHLCGCGNHGCWEQYTSGRALVREAKTLAHLAPVPAARLLELADGNPDGITGSMISRAANEGDPAALGLVADVGRWLGEGIADVAAVLDPAVVVVGGGVSELGDLLLKPAREAFTAQLSAGGYRPQLAISTATLGNDAGLIGAADLARRP
jgi:glucokinase